MPVDTDVDCAGGSGNGPSYVQGPVLVIADDVYGLDNNNDEGAASPNGPKTSAGPLLADNALHNRIRPFRTKSGTQSGSQYGTIEAPEASSTSLARGADPAHAKDGRRRRRRRGPCRAPRAHSVHLVPQRGPSRRPYSARSVSATSDAGSGITVRPERYRWRPCGVDAGRYVQGGRQWPPTRAARLNGPGEWTGPGSGGLSDR